MNLGEDTAKMVRGLPHLGRDKRKTRNIRIYSNLEALSKILSTATSPNLLIEKELEKVIENYEDKRINLSPFRRVLKDYRERVYQQDEIA